MAILHTIQRRSSLPVYAMPIEMPNEVISGAQLEKQLARAKQCSREAAFAGVKAAAATALCTAIPTFASVRMSKWARVNLGNPVAQTVIITYAAGMAYFIAGEKKVVELARKHSLEAVKDTGFKGVEDSWKY